MIRWFCRRKLDKAEKELGVPVEYARHILDTSVRAFFTLVKFVGVSTYRRALPPAPYHVARVVATTLEDCGPCVQIAVNLAKKDRVSLEVLRAALDGKPDDLPEELADVYHFTAAVVQRTGEEDIYRQRIRGRHGEEALIELAMAIATCRVFPVTKRALGYARSCSKVSLQV